MSTVLLRKRTNPTFTFFASCAMGLESVLENEIKNLGGECFPNGHGGVRFSCDLEKAYEIVLSLRSASRLFLELGTVSGIRSPDDWYKWFKNFDWSKVFTPDRNFAIFVTSHLPHPSMAKHSPQFLALKAKDGVVDFMRMRFGERPSVDRNDPDVTLRLHHEKDLLTVYFDFSGPSLHERGYRVAQGAAPIKENLAAGLLLHCGWKNRFDQGEVFLDAFCGSGTLLCEAAMIALNIPPSMLRSKFGFFFWRQHDEILFERSRKKLEAGIVTSSRKVFLYGSDIDPTSIEQAKTNLERLGVLDSVKLNILNAKEIIPPPSPKPGLWISNPPYGERLEKGQDLSLLYREMSHQMKHFFKGWSIGFISSDVTHFHALGFKPKSKLKLRNGPLESSFFTYQMY